MRRRKRGTVLLVAAALCSALLCPEVRADGASHAPVIAAIRPAAMQTIRAWGLALEPPPPSGESAFVRDTVQLLRYLAIRPRDPALSLLLSRRADDPGTLRGALDAAGFASVTVLTGDDLPSGAQAAPGAGGNGVPTPKPSDSEMDRAIETLRRLGRDIVYRRSGQWHLAVGDPARLVESGLLAPLPAGGYRRTKLYTALVRLWTAAPPGSAVRRVDTDYEEIKGYDAETVEVFAFDHRAQMTVVLINTADQERSLTLTGLTGTVATAYHTTATLDAGDYGTLPIREGAYRINLPPRSIVVVITDQGTASCR